MHVFINTNFHEKKKKLKHFLDMDIFTALRISAFLSDTKGKKIMS